MSNMDMAEVIAAHSGYTVKMPDDPRGPFLLVCSGCGDERPIINEVGKVRTPAQRHNTHVAEELTKAGYGSVHEALATAWDHGYALGIADHRASLDYTTDDFGIPGGGPVAPARANPYLSAAA